jgi:hypothetical protein
LRTPAHRALPAPRSHRPAPARWTSCAGSPAGSTPPSSPTAAWTRRSRCWPAAPPSPSDVRFNGRLSDPIEIAAYFVVAEALTNVAKHARASVVDVQVDAGADVLRVGIRDERGVADLGRGSGLVGLKDRVEALGGRIALRSPPGAGTALEIALPLDDPSPAGLPG